MDDDGMRLMDEVTNILSDGESPARIKKKYEENAVIMALLA